MEYDDLKKLLKLLRANGVLQYQSEQLNLVLSESAPQSPYKQRQEKIADIEKDFDDMTLDEQLSYSATHPLENETDQ